jgi:16S rRNA U516 pseudouridylate synthase RsuA-like enzyme
VAEVGQQVSAGAEVTLDGRAVEWERLNLLDDGSDMHANSTQGRAGGVSAVAGEERFVYIKYWKPAGVVCTTDRRIEGNVISEIGHPVRPATS